MVIAVYLALGSNMQGRWGSPEKTLRYAIEAIQYAGCDLTATSRTYKSPSLLRGQPDYVNLVVSGLVNMSAASLLRALKTIEQQAGRRTRPRWSGRPLDIDVIMAGSMCYNWPQRRAGALTLPHPEAHRRSFVLRPLCDVAPHWYHPGLKATARQLYHRLPMSERRSIQTI